ncbi:hypothetical protein L208DRAFT_1416054 [Tricholoma matsutake]|nr:hypothetical protein L208DRAFT_1416054 [Tricholoma matsutake 945]
MAGFLRKKSKQDSRTKQAHVSQPPVIPAPSVPPLYARFAGSNNVPHEPQRIISSPMVLSNARRDVAPAPQNRAGRTVAVNSVNMVRRDTETRSQRNQSNLVPKVPETQHDHGTHRHSQHPKQQQPQLAPIAGNVVNVIRRNTDVEARRPLNQLSSASTAHELQNDARSPTFSHSQQAPSPPAQNGAYARSKPAPRALALDKPLPPPYLQLPADPFSSNSPTTPTQASVLDRQNGETVPLGINSPPRPPVPMPGHPAPLSRRPADQANDPETLKHHPTFSLNSPPDLSILTLQPPSNYASALSVEGPNDLPIPPVLNNETNFRPSSSSGRDHIPRPQTLTPRPSYQSLSRQDLQNVEKGLRSDSGASTSQGNLVPDHAPAAQHQRLLKALKSKDELNTTRYNPATLVSHPAAASSNTTLPEIPSDDQEFGTPFLPSSPSSPLPHRRLSTAGYPPATGLQPSVQHVENPTTLPAHITPVAPEFYHANPPNMGVNVGAPDISRLQAYRNVLPQVPIVDRRGTSASSHHISQQPPLSGTPISHSSPSQPFPDKRFTDLPPPPANGKPLIFTAMAAVNQGSGPIPVPGRAPTMQTPAPVGYANPPFRPTHLPHVQHGYPSPPPDSFPRRKESLVSIRNPGQLPQPQQFNNTSQPISPPRELYSHAMGANRQPVQTNEPVTRRSPAKVNKLTKARTAGKSASDISTLSTYSHSSTASIPSPTHRTSSAKGLLTTPTSSTSKLPPPEPAAPPIHIEGNVVGIPLDDDPFANVEGVKVVSPVSRPATPTNTTLKGRRSKSTLRSTASRDELSVAYHDVPERELPAEPQSQTSEASSPNHSPDSPEKLLTPPLHDEEEQKEVPSDISSLAEDQEDQEDREDRITGFLSDPHLLWCLLPLLSFYDWCLVLSLSRVIRYTLVQHPQLRETALERFLKPVGYTRWAWEEPDPLSLSLQDLSDYMRGVSTPTHEYARVAGLYVHSLSVHPNLRDETLNDMVNYMGASCRAYTRVVLRIRAQAEKEASMVRTKGNFRTTYSPPSRTSSPTMSSFSHSNNSHISGGHVPSSPNSAVNALSSPLFRLSRAPLLRVFVPSPDGDWLSDKSVLACEAECRGAGVTPLMRIGDVVWDVAVGDEGNIGRLVWDGSYLIDLDYTYSPIGDLPKYMPTLAFPPSYFHRVIRMGAESTNPIAHIDLRPWGEEIAHNLQLLQDRVRTETPQGTYHNVVRWVNRSSFVIRPPHRGTMWSPSQKNYHSAPVSPRIPIPESSGLFVDPGWYGTIVVETEGTNEALADLQDRCGPGAFPPRPQGVNGRPINRDQKKVFRILREKSRPGEIWIRAVSAKERLL